MGPRPVVQASAKSMLLIVGQAPGRKVHETGIPFNDPSGDRLRAWLDIDRDTFYDDEKVALIPMGFCFPGTGRSGDLPPRKECAEAWREELLQKLTNVKLTLVLGQYATRWHLPEERGSLTEIVSRWNQWAPQMFVAPHPSPRNQLWLKKNPWFEEELIPALRSEVGKALGRRRTNT